ncbi:hypothetical protein DFO47_10691 [Arthrobacter sp. AG258]|uniref:hypothetical protein n=1 Tax=Arthrobacter sp. AG258 TaxID=2183899 RepID=UPI00106060FA|nr:hypothetical protein [Arthrobacter sp. AG258]TDT78698.1 hypothetical protein DFO47_10691 [Arthrobacter sp. AG258]
MRNWLTRIAIPITIAATATLAGVAGPAAAAPSTPNPTDPFSLQDVFGNDCPGFNVTAQLTGKSKEISHGNEGVISISPGMTITLTANGKTVKYLITGTTHAQTLPDGSKEVVSVGENLLIVPAVDGQHAEGLFYTTGNVNYALTPTGGEGRLFSGPGQVVDVCALLAP